MELPFLSQERYTKEKMRGLYSHASCLFHSWSENNSLVLTVWTPPSYSLSSHHFLVEIKRGLMTAAGTQVIQKYRKKRAHMASSLGCLTRNSKEKHTDLIEYSNLLTVVTIFKILPHVSAARDTVSLTMWLVIRNLHSPLKMTFYIFIWGICCRLMLRKPTQIKWDSD